MHVTPNEHDDDYVVLYTGMWIPTFQKLLLPAPSREKYTRID